MEDRQKKLYHSGIPGSDYEAPTESKEEADGKQEKYEKENASYEASEKKKRASIPRNDGKFKMDALGSALKKTSKK